MKKTIKLRRNKKTSRKYRSKKYKNGGAEDVEFLGDIIVKCSYVFCNNDPEEEDEDIYPVIGEYKFKRDKLIIQFDSTRRVESSKQGKFTLQTAADGVNPKKIGISIDKPECKDFYFKTISIPLLSTQSDDINNLRLDYDLAKGKLDKAKHPDIGSASGMVPSHILSSIGITITGVSKY